MVKDIFAAGLDAKAIPESYAHTAVQHYVAFHVFAVIIQNIIAVDITVTEAAAIHSTSSCIEPMLFVEIYELKLSTVFAAVE